MDALKIVTIKRTHHRYDGTFGPIDFEGKPFGLTIELPWKDNEAEISCIPPGEYMCKRFSSPTHPDTFEVCNVPNRSGILFHIANTVNDLQGCIGIGEQFEEKDGLTALIMSKAGFMQFLKLTEGLQVFKLVILKV